MLRETEIAAAEGWIDPGYIEHELTQAITAIARQARRDREALRGLGLYPNSSPADCVQDALKSALNTELFHYGLRVVRLPNWRGAIA